MTAVGLSLTWVRTTRDGDGDDDGDHDAGFPQTTDAAD